MRRSSPRTFGAIGVHPPHAEAGQRIGLLGGSFNPPHAGHLQISKIALSRLQLDRLWWLVSPGNPLKSKEGLPPFAERMAACRDVVDDNRIVVTGFEADLGTTYTAATLGYLCRRHPQVDFVWVMGADCLADFHQWRHWRGIFKTLPIAVIDRPGWHLAASASIAARTFAASRRPTERSAGLATASAPAWTLLTGPLSPLSSTALRRQTGTS